MTNQKRIDELDAEILRLAEERITLGADTPEAGRQKASAACESGGECADSLRMLYNTVNSLADAHTVDDSSANELLELINRTSTECKKSSLPETAAVACQGVEGAFSQIACDRLFDAPVIMYMNSFEAVFSAIDSGLCRYGVLPLENSTAGSVNRIYDLMMKYNFYIVRSIRQKVDCALLALPGTKKDEIREIYSHEHAVNQCGSYLGQMKNARLVFRENTAAAASAVAQSGRKDIAAVASRRCASLYGLEVLDEAIQDKQNNYTRFICISRTPEIYPGSERTSLMLTLPHKPGSLYNALGCLYAHAINVVKLESRPLPDRDFEFSFYFDIVAPVNGEKFRAAIKSLASFADTFRYLGTYSEII